jgi:hypothetical protein
MARLASCHLGRRTRRGRKPRRRNPTPVTSTRSWAGRGDGLDHPFLSAYSAPANPTPLSAAKCRASLAAELRSGLPSGARCIDHHRNAAGPSGIAFAITSARSLLASSILMSVFRVLAAVQRVFGAIRGNRCARQVRARRRHDGPGPLLETDSRDRRAVAEMDL